MPVGGDYFRKLTVFETFSRLVSIYIDSAHARLFIKLACLMIVPCTFIGMILVNYVSSHLFETHDTSDSAYFLKNWAAICKNQQEKMSRASCIVSTNSHIIHLFRRTTQK